MASHQSNAQNRGILLVVASALEAKGVLNTPAPEPWRPTSVLPGVDLVISGIGKANAAGATARFLIPSSHQLVLNLGIAGSLGSPRIGDLVIAAASVFADEGVLTDEGFADCAAMGFPLGRFDGAAVPVEPRVIDRLRQALPGAHLAPIATVSTCSGTDALAETVRTRTGAAAEAMEGAAVGVVAHRLGVSFAEVRAISNTTGRRKAQQWNVPLALSRLSEVIGALAHELRGE